MMPRVLLALLGALACFAPAAAEDFSGDEGLVDYAAQPFSDHASHAVLLRPAAAKGPGLALWTLRSAAALGEATLGPNPAKDLAELRLGLQVEGAAAPAFGAAQARDYPRWSVSQAQAEGVSVSVEAVTVWPQADMALVVASFANRGDAPLKVRPWARLARGLDNLRFRVAPAPGGASLEIDRTRLFGRPALERVEALAATNPEPALLAGAALERGVTLTGSVEVELPGAWQTLRPGAGLRFPVLLDLSGRGAPAARAAWKAWALKPGVALKAAQTRWAATAARLAKPDAEGDSRLARQAALILLMAEYAPRGAMAAPLFSPAKGFHDAFTLPETTLAALGWAELDMGKAQAAVTQLMVQARSASRPAPPYTGEDLPLWEAGGLPLHAWVGPELYDRDDDRARAGAFLREFGDALVNECQWWRGHQGADGWWQYGQDSERPAYAALLPSITVPSPAAGGPVAPVPAAQGPRGDAALTALLAQAFGVAAQVAEARGETLDAAALQDAARGAAWRLTATAAAAQALAWRQGLPAPDDALWPAVLGLDRDPASMRAALAERMADPAFLPADPRQPPLAERGVLVPWRALLTLELMVRLGEYEKAEQARHRLLVFLANRGTLHEAYGPGGAALGAPGSAATAAAALYLCLSRHAQETGLDEATRALAGRFRHVRALDGSLELRLLPARPKAPQPEISMAAPKGGAILDEGAFILSSAQACSLSLACAKPCDVSLLDQGRPLFRGTRKAALILTPRARYLFEFSQTSTPAPTSKGRP